MRVGVGGRVAPPVSEMFEIFSGRMLMIRAKVLGKGSQDQACGLLFLTFALSKRS